MNRMGAALLSEPPSAQVAASTDISPVFHRSPLSLMSFIASSVCEVLMAAACDGASEGQNRMLLNVDAIA